MSQEPLIWKPTARQETFLEVPDSIFEVLYGGAAGGGKTDALLNLPLAKQFHQEPRFKGIIFRRTYPELEAEVILRSESQGYYAGCGAVYNRTEKRWKFPSGASLKFSHLEYDSDVRKHDTAEYNYIGWDELTSFTEYMYLYMFSRCRSSSSKLPSIVRSGTNPGNVGHAWVRARFVEPAPPETIIVDKKTTIKDSTGKIVQAGLKRLFIQSFAKDNHYLMQNDPQYLARLMGMAEKDRRAKLDGDWYTFGGQIFGDYRDLHYPGEQDNAVHVVPNFSIPEWWPRILCIDWGYNAMTYALWGAISPSGRLYLYREYGIKEAKISQWATEIGNLSYGEKFHDVVICQSAGQNRGEDQTIAEQFERYSSLRARLSVNEHGSRVASKLILQELFRWRIKSNAYSDESTKPFDQTLADRILRNAGLEKYKQYLNSFNKEVEDERVLPKIQIFEELTILRKTIPLCVYSDSNPEDCAEFAGDDPYDTLRYMGRAFDNFTRINKLTGFQEELERTDKVVKDLQTSNDWTSYFRKMERLEGSKVKHAISRRRHR